MVFSVMLNIYSHQYGSLTSPFEIEISVDMTPILAKHYSVQFQSKLNSNEYHLQLPLNSSIVLLLLQTSLIRLLRELCGTVASSFCSVVVGAAYLLPLLESLSTVTMLGNRQNEMMIMMRQPAKRCSSLKS